MDIDVNYDVLDRSKDIHSCFQYKQMGTYIVCRQFD